MGTHPIFESDFDCLTAYFRNSNSRNNATNHRRLIMLALQDFLLIKTWYDNFSAWNTVFPIWNETTLKQINVSRDSCRMCGSKSATKPDSSSLIHQRYLIRCTKNRFIVCKPCASRCNWQRRCRRRRRLEPEWIRSSPPSLCLRE